MSSKIHTYDYSFKLQSAFALLFFVFFIPQKGNGQTSEIRKIRNFDNHAYEVITEPMSWGDAREYASAQGGALVKIETFQEHTFLRLLMKDITTKLA